MLQFRYVRFVSRWLFAMWFGTFSLSQMNNVELARTLSWRENALFEERKEHVWGMANAFGDVVDCMCGSPLLMFDGKSTTKLTEQRNFSRAILCSTPNI